MLHSNPAHALKWTTIFAAYGAAFALLRFAAGAWEHAELFSLWFPAAGLRFAFLWWAGPKTAPVAAVAELSAGILFGTLTFGRAPIVELAGIVGPCLCYGLVIHLVCKQAKERSGVQSSTEMTFAIAAILGPVVASLGALPWIIPLANEQGFFDARMLFSSIVIFTLGDLLGILVLAPPIIWLTERKPWRSILSALPLTRRHTLEIVLVLVFAWTLVGAMRALGYGTELAPVLLASCWAGLRGGKLAAWVTIVPTAFILLPLTASAPGDVDRFHVHMLLVCIAAGAYLAGSYTDVRLHAVQQISRRDRLLFQADRLRTLRAMSVSIIHEISQPLSTISLEANGLLAASSRRDLSHSQVEEVARLLARKAGDLAELVRRLRRFGERSVDDEELVSAEDLLAGALALVQGEREAARIGLDLQPGPAAFLRCSEVELRQALVNLLRNSISASPMSHFILVTWSVSKSWLSFQITNDVGDRREQGGMGVGLIVARRIAVLHGGGIDSSHQGPNRVSYTLAVPALEGR